MKRTINAIFLLQISLCALSCNNGNGGVDYRRNITSIRGEFLQIDELIGKPYDITCMDNLLIYYDRYDGKFYSVYDVERKQFVGRYVSEGNGPGEAVPPLNIISTLSKDTLYAYQRNMAVMSLFGLPDFQMLSNITFNTSGLSAGIAKPVGMQKTKDYYIGETNYASGRFGVYNPEGEMLYTGGSYPFRGESMERIPAFILYQGHYCASPASNRFALGCLCCDHLSFYEAGENGLTLLKEYASYDIKASYPGQIVYDDDCIISYTWAHSTASYCYMLYSGKTYAAKGKRDDGGSYIIVFDWDGNYVKTLETDREIRTFCVDEAGQIIYAVALGDDGEYGIIKFKL
ncbi:MAG: TolB-like 6-bladed beta-propeller domain-containing protein [Tannerella sp.]|jgi:hypothetical protein|nr:TolB-like 6-bladed beta-propeller domain-containing protein [Tannerella sp.]